MDILAACIAIMGVVLLIVIHEGRLLEQRVTRAEQRADAAVEALLDIAGMPIADDDIDLTVADLQPVQGFLTRLDDRIRDGLAAAGEEPPPGPARRRWLTRTRQVADVVDINDHRA